MQKGVGAVKLLINFCYLARVSAYSGVMGQQLYTTINEPWKTCKPEWGEGCMTLENILVCSKDECLNISIYNLSSYIFHKKTENLRNNMEILCTIIFCIGTFVLVTVGYNYFRHGLSRTLRWPLLSMNLAGGGHIIYGTHLSTRILPGLQTLVISLAFIFFIGLGAFLYRTCYFSLVSSTGWNEDLQRSLTVKQMIFVIMEEFLHTHFMKTMFPIVFNASCALLIFSKQIIHTDIICETIINYFHALEYQKKAFIVAGVMTANIICLLPYFLMFPDVEEIFTTTTEYSSLITLEIEGIAVMYIYSYTAFSDDIHFVFGSQPASIWKVLWFFTPVVQLIGLLTYYRRIHFIAFVLIILIMLPILIGALYKLYTYINVHNTLGFFMPEVAWGMRNLNLRKIRQMHNPREETHSQKYAAACKHDCLLGSNVLSVLLREEMELSLQSAEETSFHNATKEELSKLSSKTSVDACDL